MSYDIVYILKEGIDSEELRYSLRSVCENFDYNQIWFYCGCPKDIKPDKYVPFKQKGYNKLDKVHSTFRAICENDEITSSFYLFNDDFFIMKPYKQNIHLSNGTLKHLAYLIEQNINKESFYVQYLRYTSQILDEKGYDTISYEVHAPILINREQALKVLNQFPGNTQFRSIYGNYYSIGGRLIQDPKIDVLDIMPNENVTLLSTVEESFKNGLVGSFIRNTFPEPCQYEIIKTDKQKIVFTKKKQVEKPKESIEPIEPIESTELLETEVKKGKFATWKEKLYNIFRKIKKDYFTFPYEE